MGKLISLFMMFFRIGLFTFGGGLAIVPMIQREVVSAGLMTPQQATDIVAISNMTPGPLAINAATFAGMSSAGVPGAAAATLGVVMPSVIIVLLVSKFFFEFHKNKYVAGALYGIRPAVIGLILFSAVSVGMSSFFPGGPLSFQGADLPVIAIAGASFFAIARLKVNPIICIAASAALGAIFLR